MVLFNRSIQESDEVGSGYDAPTSTHFESTLTQNKMGAGLKLLWSKPEAATSDYGNQTSLATLSSIKAVEERPNGTLEQSIKIQVNYNTADTQQWIPPNPLSGNSPTLVGLNETDTNQHRAQCWANQLRAICTHTAQHRYNHPVIETG